jgi:peptide/nickel transport system permease protein
MRSTQAFGPAAISRREKVNDLSTLDVDSTQAPQLSARRTLWDSFASPRAEELLRLARHRPGLVAGAAFLLLLAVATLFPTLLTPVDPLEASARDAFFGPSAEHWLGTDENGRDLWSRLVHGASASLLMGIGATAIGLSIGLTLGLGAGLGPRWVNAAIMRFVDVLLAFPDILLALVIITFWGDGLLNAIIAVGIGSVPRYARIVCAQALVIRKSSYVEAARTLGLHPLALVWKHVLPNAIKPVILLATIGIGGKISAGAALSFLGFGAPPPAPEWGAMLANGRNYLGNAWWLTAFPGLALMLTVLSLTAVGRELRRRSEGKTS